MRMKYGDASASYYHDTSAITHPITPEASNELLSTHTSDLVYILSLVESNSSSNGSYSRS